MKQTEALTSIRRLRSSDSEELSKLMRTYAAEMRGPCTYATCPPDWADQMLSRDFIFIYGAFFENQLVGFATVYELPDTVFFSLSGQLDDLFVSPQFRGKGLAKALIIFCADEGKKSLWSHLRWIVPETDLAAIQLYKKVAEEAPWKSFVLRLDRSNSL